MRSLVASFVLLLSMSTMGFAQKRSTAQGIQGQVIWKAGNQMPSPDRPKAAPTGVPREVYVYVLTNNSQTTKNEQGFIETIQTKLVKKFKTDKQGNFKVSLPVGTYSIFTKEEKGLYANLFDGEMNIFPIQVKKGKYTKVNFEISYMTVF